MLQLSYPGVYIEELPSGQHTITGVATSITAFLGRAVSGPIDEPITIFSFGDYERQFGGLAYDYPLSYAVQDFFLNGGNQAVIVRLFKPKTQETQADWNEECKSAVATVKSAVQGVNGSNLSPASIVQAATTAAATFDGEPKKSAAQSVVSFASAPPPGTYADGDSDQQKAGKLQTAIGAKEFPPIAYPGLGTASLSLDSFIISPAIDNIKAFITAALGSIFDGSGNALKAAFTPDHASTIRQAVQDAGTLIKDGSGSKLAQKITAGIATSDTLQATFKELFSNSSGAVKGEPKPTSTIFTDFLDKILAPVVNSFFDGTGNAFVATAPTAASTITAITTKLQTLPQKTQDALKPLNAIKGATVKAVLEGAVSAVLTVSEAQVLKLVAASPGDWGNRLSATIDTTNITENTIDSLKKQYGLTVDQLFNLTVVYTQPNGAQISERFINLTLERRNIPNRIDLKLQHESQLVRVADITTSPTQSPPSGVSASKGVGGYDSDSLDDDETIIGDENLKTGLYTLENVDLFNLLCIPPDQRGSDTSESVYQFAAEYCQKRRAILIVDPPTDWTNKTRQGELSSIDPSTLGIVGEVSRNAAVYFPRVRKADLAMKGQPDTFPACGIIAGVIASTDLQRGVWKAPAGQDAALLGIQDLELRLTDAQNGVLNQVGINCLRSFPIIGSIVWGARTLRGADQLADDYKYLPVRRLTLYIEESLYRGTKWAVFEPNDETLWSSLRLNIGTFMADLSRQGAFYDYRVVCDKTTTTQYDIDRGIVKVLVAFAPVKPAEFVVLQIQQQAGQQPV